MKNGLIYWYIGLNVTQIYTIWQHNNQSANLARSGSTTVSLLGHKRAFFDDAPSGPAHYSSNMALANSIYQTLFRRTSTFAITIMVGAVFFERMFDQGGDAIFEQLNRGVRVF